MRLWVFETFLDFLRNTLQICLLSQFACERKNSAIHFFWKLNSLWFFHRKSFYRHIKNFRNSGKPQSISSVCFVKYPMRTRVPIQRYFFLKESRIKISPFPKILWENKRIIAWQNAVYVARINCEMGEALMRAQVPQKKLVYRAES